MACRTAELLTICPSNVKGGKTVKRVSGSASQPRSAAVVDEFFPNEKSQPSTSLEKTKDLFKARKKSLPGIVLKDGEKSMTTTRSTPASSRATTFSDQVIRSPG